MKLLCEYVYKYIYIYLFIYGFRACQSFGEQFLLRKKNMPEQILSKYSRRRLLDVNKRRNYFRLNYSNVQKLLGKYVLLKIKCTPKNSMLDFFENFFCR